MSHFLFHNNTASLNDLWYESHASVIKMVAMELGGSDKIPELLEKYLGQKMKVKAPKDPNKPKRAKTAFMFYCAQERPKHIEKQKKKGEKVVIGDIAKILGAGWKKLSDSKKKPFVQAAEKDKARYEKEMSEYNEKNGL
jgi:high mobility group protein B1